MRHKDLNAIPHEAGLFGAPEAPRLRRQEFTAKACNAGVEQLPSVMRFTR